jgi:hypothetical protein
MCLFFDINNQCFEFFAHINTMRCWAGSFKTRDNILFVFGGLDSNFQYVNCIERHLMIEGDDFDIVSINNQELLKGVNFM